MAEEEVRKVSIVWEVEDDTREGLDSVARSQETAAKAASAAAKQAAAEQAAAAKTAAAEQIAAAKAVAAAAKAASAEQAAAAKAASAASKEAQREEREWAKAIRESKAAARAQAAERAALAKSTAAAEVAAIKTAEAAREAASKTGMKGTALAVKGVAEQAQSAIGKLTGMLGAAGFVAAAVTGIALATWEWATSQKEVDKAIADGVKERERQKIVFEEGIEQHKRDREFIYAQKKIQSDNAAQAAADATDANASEIEHLAKLTEISGGSQREVNALLIEALSIRQDAAGLASKEGIALGRQIEVLEAQSSKPKRGGGGGSSGPSAADLARAGGQGRVDQLASELALAEAAAKLAGTTDREASVMIERRRDAKLAELDLEREVLAVTRAKNSVERQGLVDRGAAIEREAALANLQARNEARVLELGLVRQVADEARALLAAESAGEARVLDLRSARLARDIEIAKLAQDGAKVHALTLESLEQQARFQEQTLATREQEIKLANPADELARIKQRDELEQVAHDRKLARLSSEVALAQAVDAEEQRIAEAQAQRLEARAAAINTAIGTFESIQGSIQTVADDMIAGARASADADLEATKSNLAAKTSAQQAALDKQIEQARGNTSLVRDLNRKKATLDKSTQAQIEAAEKAHNAKRQKSEMQHQGIMLLVQAAVSTAKAAAAYPVIPSMVAHGIAAGVNLAYGIMLLAGKVPGAGGGAGASAGAGAGATGTAASSSSGATPNKVPESVGGRAAERQGNTSASKAGGASSGNVIYLTVNAMGSVDDAAAQKIAMAAQQGMYSREGAGPK